MARIRRYINQNVYEAAKKRIHHIADTHDTLAVCFSGGKDSLTVLHLTREVLLERGDTRPVNVVFRDEELIPDEVINFVDEHRRAEWVNLYWFCIPLASTKFVLGKVYDYIQWDPAREHVRPMPEWGIRPRPGEEGLVLTQFTADAYIADRCGFRGKVAFITGIRAAESLVRFQSAVNKLNDNYINASSSPRVSLCKPAYDWQEDDVFYYFYERQIRYCPVYDLQHASGGNLRVATPLLAEGAKLNMHKLREQVPEFWDRVLRIFPEVAVQERYWRDVDREALKKRYGQYIETVREYISEQVTDPKQRAKALARYEQIAAAAAKNPRGYPADYVFAYFVAGSYKRMLSPKASNASKRATVEERANADRYRTN